MDIFIVVYNKKGMQQSVEEWRTVQIFNTELLTNYSLGFMDS